MAWNIYKLVKTYTSVSSMSGAGWKAPFGEMTVDSILNMSHWTLSARSQDLRCVYLLTYFSALVQRNTNENYYGNQ